jgi:hypothetical protein
MPKSAAPYSIEVLAQMATASPARCQGGGNPVHQRGERTVGKPLVTLDERGMVETRCRVGADDVRQRGKGARDKGLSGHGARPLSRKAKSAFISSRLTINLAGG